MRKKIIFFTGAMGRGGAERVISLLSEYYIEQGWEVQIAMILHSHVEYELSKSIKVVDLSYCRGIKKGFIRTIKKVKRYVENEKPDVVVSFMAQICLIVGIALRKKNVPQIMSERIDPSRVNRNIIYKKVLEKIYEKVDRVVFQTERTKKYFNKKIQENSCIIANPIKVYAQVETTSEHRIVTAGRLTKQKNHEMLISSFEEIHKKYPAYTLTIYGDGPLKEKLKGQIKEKKLDDCIFLPGNVPDLHDKMKNAEIFVLSSDFEGLSNALLEAMMMGLPVISTDCAGSDEIIENGKNGFLIPVGDKFALTESIEELISDKSLRNDMSESAKKSVEYCKVENIIEQWLKIINKVIGV